MTKKEKIDREVNASDNENNRKSDKKQKRKVTQNNEKTQKPENPKNAEVKAKPDVKPKSGKNRRFSKPARKDKPEPFEKPEATERAHKPVKSVKNPIKEYEKETCKLKIIPLGGINEIGKNMTAVEYGNDIIVIDCGLGFPDEEMPGIDLVIPDITYLEENRDKVRAILLTHGHEDHVGAVPYILRRLNVPVYGTKLTLGIVQNKLEEFIMQEKPILKCVSAGDTVKLGAFGVEFIHVNHSIADACALAITTPLGVIVHTGDFKLDLTPVESEIMDIARLGEIGRRGTLLLMCESTNAERPGYTPSERKVGESLEYIFSVNGDKRIVIATFSSNVHRVQQIIDTSRKYGRKVAITGRSMLNIVNAAVELGYMNVPAGTLIDISEIKKYAPKELTVVSTGSQGEPMSALYRMAFGDHSQVSLSPSDVVIFSASAIPGNEKLINRIVNELTRKGVKVIHDSFVEVHVSGHACQEELKLMQALLKPRYFMPVHGEYKHLAANRDLALYMGMNPKNIFIADTGNVLEIDRKGARLNGTVQAGNVLVDGYGVGDVGSVVLRDRLHLAQDGLIAVVATIDESYGELVSGPDIVSRGFVYVKESDELIEEARNIASRTITDYLNGCRTVDWVKLKGDVKNALTSYLYSKTGRKPMILPIIMNI